MTFLLAEDRKYARMAWKSSEPEPVPRSGGERPAGHARRERRGIPFSPGPIVDVETPADMMRVDQFPVNSGGPRGGEHMACPLEGAPGSSASGSA
jgi:hypothetical protein